MDVDSVGLADPIVVGQSDPYLYYGTSVQQEIRKRQAAFADGLQRLSQNCVALTLVAEALVSTLRAGGKVLVAGNGGSAAEAQHFAAELVGRFKRERRAYAAMALTVDSSILTAIGNDFGFADVFARQVEAFGQPGDLLLLYSTSGKSENLLRAASRARQQAMTVAAVTGADTCPLEAHADLCLRVPATDTPIVQELQMIVTHILCEIAERELQTSDTLDGMVAG